MMVQHTLNRGYTLVEMCIVLVGISLLTCVYLPIHHMQDLDSNIWPNHYLYQQSEAMRTAKVQYIHDLKGSLYFNGKGNVNHAQTVQIKDSEYIVELGGGRLVQK